MSAAAASEAESLSYEVRRDLFSPPVTYTLEPGGLCWQATGGPPARVPYSAIHRLHLVHDPTRFARGRHLLHVHAGNTRVSVLNTHFAGVGDFEDRSARWTPLVLELHRRVAAANPAVECRGGLSALRYVAMLVVGWGAVAFLIGLLVFFAFSIPLGALVDAVVVLFMVPSLISWTRSNYPRTYRPDAIPAEILPP